MNIFISWSGDRSHQVALLFKDWIKGVVQAAKPWVSSEDIESGTRWFAQISDQIDATSHGVICITHENKEKPWILYEAGALSKGQGNATYVIPLLVDLESQDIIGPLAQFNAVIANKRESMIKLVLDLNKRLPTDSIIDEAVLKKVFAAFWPEFESGLSKVIADTQATAPPKKKREEDSMIVEILSTVRGLDKRMKALEIKEASLGKITFDKIEFSQEVMDVLSPRTAYAHKQIVKEIAEAILAGKVDGEIVRQIQTTIPRLTEDFILGNIDAVRKALTDKNT